MSGDNDRGK